MNEDDRWHIESKRNEALLAQAKAQTRIAKALESIADSLAASAPVRVAADEPGPAPKETDDE